MAGKGGEHGGSGRGGAGLGTRLKHCMSRSGGGQGLKRGQAEGAGVGGRGGRCKRAVSGGVSACTEALNTLHFTKLSVSAFVGCVVECGAWRLCCWWWSAECGALWWWLWCW